MKRRQTLCSISVPDATGVRLLLVQDVSEFYDVKPGPVLFVAYDECSGSEAVIGSLAMLGEYLREKGTSVKHAIGHDAEALEMIAGLEIDDRVVSDLSVHRAIFSDVPDYVEGPIFHSDRVVFWTRRFQNKEYQCRVLSFDPLLLFNSPNSPPTSQSSKSP